MYLGRRAEPVGNKKLHKMEIQRRQDALKMRLATVRPSIDNAPPKTLGIKPRNLKKEQLLEDRYSQIEHENRVLLSRMSGIMNKSAMDTVSEAWTYGHSLNRDRRRRELQRISEENLGILKRIQAVQPVYSAEKWEEERMLQEQLVEAISEYKGGPGGAGLIASASGSVSAPMRPRSRSPETLGGRGGPPLPSGGGPVAAPPPLSARGGMAGSGRAVMGLPLASPPVGAAAAAPISARGSARGDAGPPAY